jgi:hypothetical protein
VLRHSVDHARRGGQVFVLQRPERDRSVVPGDPEHRAAEVENRLLRENGGDLGAEARHARGFLNDDGASCLGHGP